MDWEPDQDAEPPGGLQDSRPVEVVPDAEEDDASLVTESSVSAPLNIVWPGPKEDATRCLRPSCCSPKSSNLRPQRMHRPRVWSWNPALSADVVPWRQFWFRTVPCARVTTCLPVENMAAFDP